MAYEATLSDWLSLLGVENQFTEAHEGQRDIASTLAILYDARSSWPDVNQDYIGILDVASDFVLALRTAIADQAKFLGQLRASVEEMNSLQDYITIPDPPAAPTDRLLNAEELIEVDKIVKQLDDASARITDAPPDPDEDEDPFSGNPGDNENEV